MSQLPEAVLKLIELSEKATHGAELLPVKTVKCSCGHPKCTYYGLNNGSFLQGCGWDKPTAELYAALVNWFRFNGPQELFEAGRSSMKEEAAKVRGAAMAMLEAIEHEAVASLAASVAVDNFSDPTPDVDAAEKAMLVASEKTRELEEALGCYFHKGKWHEGIRPGGRHDQNRRVR